MTPHTVQIKVDGLACPFCAYGLEKKLKEIKDAGLAGREITITAQARTDHPKGHGGHPAVLESV